MPEMLSCPRCSRSLEVPAELLGQEVQCTACQHVFLAATTDITAQTPAPGTSFQDRRRRGMARRAAADQDDDAAEGDAVDIRAQLRGEYRPANTLASAVLILFGLNLLLHLVMMGGLFLQHELADRLVRREVVPEAELHSNDSRQMAIGLAQSVVYLVGAIVFLIWFYRVHVNLAPLGAQQTTYTSGWAVGFWFVPFLNLVRPVQIAQEIWQNSDPDAVSKHSLGIAPSGKSPLIMIWWAACLISNAIAYISARMSSAVKTPEALQGASAFGMFVEALSVVAALLAIAVVWNINSRQTARAQALGIATP